MGGQPRGLSLLRITRHRSRIQMRLSGYFTTAASNAACTTASDAAEHFDKTVALIEHIERVAQALDRLLALEHDAPAANEADLAH
jgi:hypothetical protein